MKTKKIGKLALTKKTIANLDAFEMGRAHGGATATTCDTCAMCQTNTCNTDCNQNTCDCTAGSCPSYPGTYC